MRGEASRDVGVILELIVMDVLIAESAFVRDTGIASDNNQ